MNSQSAALESRPMDEVSWHDYWRVLVRRRAFLACVICLAAVGTILVTFLQWDIYESKITIVPLAQSNQATMAGLLAASGLSGLLGGVEMAASPSVRLLAILQSRTLAEDVIQRLDLLHILFANLWDANNQRWLTDQPPTLAATLLKLKDLVSIANDEATGIISITAAHPDRVLAAAIANQHIEALQRSLNENAFSLSKKNRIFLTAQVQNTQKDLVAAEEDLRNFEQKYGIVALDAQTTAAITVVASLEGQIMAKEVQLGVLQRTMTGASREVYLLQEELRGLRNQLAQLQQGMPEKSSGSENQRQNGQMWPPFREAPDIKLQYVRLQRNAILQNKIFGFLIEQLEQAKVLEARDETAFQIVDKGVPAEQKSQPRRLLSLILGTFISSLLGVMWLFFSNFLSPTIRTRGQVERQVEPALLATIPPMEAPQHRRWWRRAPTTPVQPVQQQPPTAAAAEALRYLHARLKHLADGHSTQTVLFSSAGSEEAAMTMLANLAVVAANVGEKTLLVEANFHCPMLHILFQCAPAPGLAEMLAHNPQSSITTQASGIDNLDIIPAGTITPTTWASLESSAFDVFLARCKETYDLVLFAAPPAIGMTDAAVLGSKVDITCLVLTCGVSHLTTVAEAKEVLEATRARVVGVILTNCEA